MNMQKLVAASCLLVLLSCSQEKQDALEVKGTIKNAPASVVYLEEVAIENNQPVIVDSAIIKKNGAYELSTLTKDETIYNLRLGGNRFPFLSFINDAKEITINADLKNVEDPYTVEGSPASGALKEYLYTVGKKIQALGEAGFKGDTLLYKKAQRDSIRMVSNRALATARADIRNYTTSFLNRSNHPVVTIYALSSYQSIASNPAFGIEPFSDLELRTMMANAAKKFPNNKTVATINQQLQGAPKTAPDFTLPDSTGKPIALSSFKGKYVLVDFWASWCKPCREENPNIVAAYKKFKDRNFTIVGVSLDKEKAPWVQAIQQDSLVWTHVSDLKFWNSKVVPLYGFNAIPYNVLIDPNGMVIGEQLTGAALHNKLAEVLK